jgi:hypothetical protein
MIRYHIPSERFEIFVGWSPGTQTFFAQVWPADGQTDHDGPLLWVGLTHDEIRSLEVLRTYLRPYTTIPDDIAFSLNIDFATSAPHAALQDLLHRIEAAA